MTWLGFGTGPVRLGIIMKSNIEKIQKLLGAKADGIWGPKSQAALNSEIKQTAAEGNPTLQKIQRILAVAPDGFWGPNLPSGAEQRSWQPGRLCIDGLQFC